MMRVGSLVTAGLSIALLAGCGGGGGGVDWNGPENLMVREETATKGEGVELQYWSLIDSPCKPVYEALTDFEHYRDFIPGVDSTSLLASSENSKTILIAQRVIGRQNNAKVEWKWDASKPRIDFKTLASDVSFNEGYYEFQASPDGKRCLLHTLFLVKQKEGAAGGVPDDQLAQATRDNYLAAAKGVKKRATGGQ